jgi:hypothetical protein
MTCQENEPDSTRGTCVYACIDEEQAFCAPGINNCCDGFACLAIPTNDKIEGSVCTRPPPGKQGDECFSHDGCAEGFICLDGHCSIDN